MDGVGSLQGWQWLFILEGVPSALMGLCVLFYLDNTPDDAVWLSALERELLTKRLADDELRTASEGRSAYTVRDAFGMPEVWMLSALYFSIVMGLYGISFWLPQIIRESITADESLIGWISIIPWVSAAVVMVINGIHSDLTGERRWHIAFSCLIGSAAFALSAMPFAGGWYGIAALSVATAGIMSALSCFWSLPPSILAGSAAAAGIAIINSFGNIAGYVSPEMAGIIRDATGGRMSPVLALFSATLLLAALLTLLVSRGGARNRFPHH